MALWYKCCPPFFGSKLFHMTNSYTIAFTYFVENGKMKVDLVADVDEHHSDTWYHVKNLRTTKSGIRQILPDVQLKKVKGTWVHKDSERETDLSRAIGAALDASREPGTGDHPGE